MTLASVIMLATVPMLVNFWVNQYREIDQEKTLDELAKENLGLPVNETYDFIIVGGGTAGCVLARRLSDEKYKVLLLEAGGNPVPPTKVPILSVYTKFHPDINFAYQSTKQTHAGLANGGIIKIPAGKMMGGSSSHGDMMYERGHPRGYDEWAYWTKDDSWSYSKVLPFFKKSEDYMGKFSNANQQHGVGGLMTISRPEYAPAQDTWLAAGEQQKYKVVDANGPQQIGFSPNEFMKKKGKRVGTYSAYIEPIENSSSTLTVRRYSVAQEITFTRNADNQPVASGVVYKRHGVLRYASASKEVILSAGAYMSPILLIKSGIGPASELEKAKKLKDAVSILPGVGENLMDHPCVEVGPISVKDKSKAWFIDQNLTFNDFDDFLGKGYGPLTSSYTVGVAEAFIASQGSKMNPKEGADWPDLQIYYEYLGYEPNAGVCYVGFNRPHSRGRVTLNASATDMEDPFLPIVELNFLKDEADIEATIDGIEFCLNTMKTTAFKQIGAQYTGTPIDGCKHLSMLFGTRLYWRCFIQQMADSAYHTAGTCKMGAPNDNMAVVDSKLKVRGVDKLRVIDASIMPRVSNANIAAPVVMIAEKGAQEVIDSWKNKN